VPRATAVLAVSVVACLAAQAQMSTLAPSQATVQIGSSDAPVGRHRGPV